MKKQTTRRALVMSLLSLLLCVSMLVGTTFAWFTDSVTSGLNQIVAGNLDVEVYYGDSTDSIADVDTLFNDVTLWEPGAMAWEKLTVANVGNLALKYNVSVNFSNAVATADGKTLADVLQVAVLDTVPTRDSIKNAELAPMKDFVLASEKPLFAGEDNAFYLAIYWAPGANDNDYNMNNGETTVLSIDLGISVVATQYTKESDSFDNQYDAEAAVKVATLADLKNALAAGGYIQLANDITADGQTLTVAAGKTVVLDLNGKTLTNEIAKSVGPVIKNLGTLTVTGDGAINSTAVNGGAAIVNTGKLTLNGGTYNGAPSDISISYASYAVSSTGAGSQLILNGATINGRGAIAAEKGTKVTVNGGNYHSPAAAWGHCVYADGADTEVTIEDGTFSEGFTSAPGQYNYMILAGNGAKVTVNGGTFSAWDSDAPMDLCELKGNGTIEISGGTFGFDPSNQGGNNHVATGYEVTNNGNGTWTVAPYKVGNSSELASALKAGRNVQLTADVTLNTADLDSSTIAINQDTVIDLNGYNLDASASVRRPFEIASDADLTINAEGSKIVYGTYGLVFVKGAASSNIVINGGSFYGEMDNGSFLKPKSSGAVSIELNDVTVDDRETSISNPEKLSYLMDCSAQTGELAIAITGGNYTVANGIVGGRGNTKITVKDATFNVISCAFESTGKSVLTIDNSTINVVSGNLIANSAPAACVAVSSGGKAYITDSTLKSDYVVLSIYTSGVGNLIKATDCTITCTGSEAYKIYLDGSAAVPKGQIIVDGTVVAER